MNKGTPMKTTAKKPAKSSAKAAGCKVVRASSGNALRGNMLTGQALIDDMRAFGREVAADPALAKDLLMKMGVMTKTGKLKTLIRA